jgi:ketosteroid isomerase-like protein
LPTFAQQKDTVDPKLAQQIRALAAKFDEAYNKNDAATVAAPYTDDAVYGRNTEHLTVGRPSKKRMQTISSIGTPSTMSIRWISGKCGRQ